MSVRRLQLGRRGGLVIVGAGHAGWALAESVRDAEPSQPITLVTACSGDRYDKPWLSVAHARRQRADDLVKESGIEAAQRLGVRLCADTRALRVHVHAGLLATTRGVLPYDRLVLAHGAEPALPAALPASRCWRVNHLQAYQRLRGVLDGASRDVLIVGAGLVGCELANDLAVGGHRVTLVDTQSEPLARWRDQGAGPALLRAWQGHAIRFVGGVQIRGTRTEPGPSGAPRTVVLTADGRELSADIVVAATGLQTPDRLARSAGLTWNQGIVVDPTTLQTSLPRIHALGDCIAIDGRSSRFIEPIGRQVRTLTAALLQRPPVPYEHRAEIVRLKTPACPLTLH